MEELGISLPDDLPQGLESDKAIQVPTENTGVYKHVGSLYGIRRKFLSTKDSIMENRS